MGNFGDDFIAHLVDPVKNFRQLAAKTWFIAERRVASVLAQVPSEFPSRAQFDLRSRQVAKIDIGLQPASGYFELSRIVAQSLAIGVRHRSRTDFVLHVPRVSRDFRRSLAGVPQVTMLSDRGTGRAQRGDDAKDRQGQELGCGLHGLGLSSSGEFLG